MKKIIKRNRNKKRKEERKETKNAYNTGISILIPLAKLYKKFLFYFQTYVRFNTLHLCRKISVFCKSV